VPFADLFDNLTALSTCGCSRAGLPTRLGNRRVSPSVADRVGADWDAPRWASTVRLRWAGSTRRRCLGPLLRRRSPSRGARGAHPCHRARWLGFHHPDLAAAADAVVGKIGYSTLAETCRARIPYGFVPRDGFRESAVLARWLLARGRGVRIGAAAFASGEWVTHVPDLLALGRPPERFRDGAGEAARLILERFPL
jgi:hypothetical protein